MNEKTTAALSYILGAFSGIIVLILEKENKFIRFHALQSTLWFLLLMIIGWVVGFVISLFTNIPLIGGVFSFAFNGFFTIGGIFYLLSKVFLMLRAYSGAVCKIPAIGNIAWAQVNKGKLY